MKIESNKINFRSLDAHNVEIYHDTDRIRFWTGPMKVPFGIDENFGKHYIRVELDEDSKQDTIFKKIIEKIEGIMIKRLNIGEGQLKKIIRRKVGNKDIADIRVKQIKNNVLTECEYENPRDNYLKTLFDIEKGDIVRIYVEIFGYWDYREGGTALEESTSNPSSSIGLLVNALKVKVLRNNQIEYFVA